METCDSGYCQPMDLSPELINLPRRGLHVLAATTVLGATRAGGALLATATTGLGLARKAAKPLHPRGEVWDAVLVRHGNSVAETGVPWLDRAGSDDAVGRVSAAIGLPRVLPDIHGLAIRLDHDGESSDILLATTGTGRLSRYLLRFSRSGGTSPHTTLLPYRGPEGPLLLAAFPQGRDRFDLAYASAQGSWTTFATLHLVARSDREFSYDPTLNPPPGLENYSWVTRLRAPAYRSARRTRGESSDVGGQTSDASGGQRLQHDLRVVPGGDPSTPLVHEEREV